MKDDFPKMSLNDVKTLFQAMYFSNGMTYYNSNKVLNPSRFQNKLYAQVQGSGSKNYTIILEFDEKVKPKCNCPAARRTPFCKHVAAVLIGWAKDSNGFIVSDSVPELAKATSKKARVKKGKKETEELIARGLESLETLITELGLSGLSTITESRVEQVQDLAENLRTYKLRRLSTLLTRFARELNTLLTDKENFSLATYANLLSDIVITAKGVQAIQQGKLKDPKYMEELVGKTWSERQLTPRDDLQLVEVFFEFKQTVDEFKLFTSYFIELASGDILTEKLIVPKMIKKDPNAEKRSYAGLKLTVSEGFQYPGYSPCRVKLKLFKENSVTPEDIEAIGTNAQGDFTQAVEAFRIFKKDFFAPSAYYTLLKPEGFYASDRGLSVFDPAGKAFKLLLTDRSSLNLEQVLETSPVSAVFGKIHAVNGSIKIEPLSVIVLSRENPVRTLI